MTVRCYGCNSTEQEMATHGVGVTAGTACRNDEADHGGLREASSPSISLRATAYDSQYAARPAEPVL
jgi:hypothetical protein